MMLRIIIKYIVITFLFVFMLELCARIDDSIKYDAPFFGKYNNLRLRSSDSDGLRHNIPNASFEKWSNNNFGFRGSDIDREKPKGTQRVFCMGTSESYGLFESPGNEWPAQLANQLSSSENHEVINASTVGLSFGSYNDYMKKYVFPFNPDKIIMLINPLSYFSLKERRSGVTTTARKKSIQAKVTKISVSSLLEHIRIKEKVKQMLKNFLPQNLIENYQNKKRVEQINYMEQKYLKDKSALDEIPVAYIKQYEDELTQIIDTLKARNIEIILATYPVLVDEPNIEKYKLILLESRRFHIELSYQGMVAASNSADSILFNIAKSKNVGFVDCNKELPKTDEYFGDNVHYTDAGAKLMAAKIADYLIDSNNNQPKAD